MTEQLVHGLPEWLVGHLSAIGRHDSDGVRRAARFSRCDDCGRKVLAGLDGDVAAMPVVCEPYEVDLNGEALAMVLGLHTYTLTRRAGSKSQAWNLDYRDRWAIEKGQRTALVVQHRCDLAVPRAARSFLPQVDKNLPLDGSPPF
jgi:hypothetical protein